MKIKGPARSPEPSAPPPEFGRWFYCHTCDPQAGPTHLGSQRMSASEAKEHLRQKHGLNASGGDFGGERIMVVHGDAPSYSVRVSHWKIGGITLVEHLCTPRRPMR